MGLIKSKGNMYEFTTHQWNPIRGKCLHNCSYCYVKKWGEQKSIHLDEEYLNDNLGRNNFIFVCSGCDMFAENIEATWVIKVLKHCANYRENKYLFQTKNPNYLSNFTLPYNSIACVTIESNRDYPDIMNNAPLPSSRMAGLVLVDYPIYITIEPILDFDLKTFVFWMQLTRAIQINIGADSKGHNLPEPPKEKILELILELQKFTKVHLKKNLNRLIK